MQQHNVTEFIVIAPAGMGKAMEWAQDRLLLFLEAHFPSFRFRVEPFGPFANEWDFGVIPIMNRMPGPDDNPERSDVTYMCHLEPTVVPEIMQVLRSFDPKTATTH